MNFFRKLSPAYTPPHIAEQGDVMILRDKILQIVFILLIATGTVPVFTNSWEAWAVGNYPEALFFSVNYLIVLGLAAFRNISYGVRGHYIISIFFMFGSLILFRDGEIGTYYMYTMAFAAITAVLFPRRHVIGAVLLGQSLPVFLLIHNSANAAPLGATASLLPRLETMVDMFLALGFTSLIAGSITAILTGMEANLAKQAELTRNLEYERDSLENRIRERTRSLSRRMAQLRATSEISRMISVLSEPEAMINSVVELIRERFDLYYVGIFLLDQTRQNAVLHAGTGEAGKRMFMEGHHLAIGGSSMIGWSIANHRARIALDVGTEAVRFNNPHLPLTRSELALPISAHDEVLGALTIQSDKPNAFDEDDIVILQSLADALAIALENDRLYNETRESLEEIRALNRAYLQQAWSEVIDSYGELAYDYENPLALEDGQETSSIQVPLMLRSEEIGQISLEMDHLSLTDEEKAFIENVTTQTAIALENARLLQETERRAAQEQKLNELTTRFSRAMSIDEIIKSAVQELGQLPAVAEVSIQLNPGGELSKPQTRLNGGGNGKEHAS